MKHMRKALSLLLVLAMVVCFAVPALAASPEGATVTVYITKDLFTKGGIDSSTGNKIDQEYIGGIPTSYIKKVEVDISGISTTELKALKASYNNPDAETQTTVNVLDAIAYALSDTKSGAALGYTGGWDTWNTPNGGYISSVDGYTGTPKVTEEEIGDTLYTKYSGSGWNIAFGTGTTLTPPEYYGTYYGVTDGMIIVFDFSKYELYYAQ